MLTVGSILATVLLVSRQFQGRVPQRGAGKGKLMKPHITRGTHGNEQSRKQQQPVAFGIIGALAILLASSCGLSAGTLAVSADAHIDGFNQESNYGSAEILSIGQDVLGGHKAYLLFDASSLGTTNIDRIGDLQIVSAFEETRTYIAYVITGEGANDWTESEINWLNAPANDVDAPNRNFVAHPGQSVTLLGFVSGGGAGAVLTIPLGPDSAGETALREALNTGDRKATIGIRYNSTQDSTVGFYSRESEGGTRAAALTILPIDGVIPATMDAHIDGNFPGVNLGFTDVLSISQTALGGNKAYLMFDASFLGEKPVERVERLRVYWSASQNITRTLMFRLITGTNSLTETPVNDWHETAITWENAPGNDVVGTDRNFGAFPGETLTTLGTVQYVAGNPRELNLVLAEGSAQELALLTALNTGDRKATIGVNYNSSQSTTVGIYSREREGGTYVGALWLGAKAVVPPAVRWAGFQSGLPVLELDGPANASYTIMASPNLIEWTDLETIFVPTPPAQWIDSTGGGAPQWFYRVRVP